MPNTAVHKAMWMERARTVTFWLLALLVASSIGMLLAANPAHAATFTVDRAGDAQDANLANAACDINVAVAGSQCTLRAAIQEANDTSGDDTINFNIVSSDSVKTISPASALPTVTEAITINGYTQPGAEANTLAVGNDAVLKIQLNGASAGADANGLEIAADNSTVKGLVINRFDSRGIVVEGFNTTGNRIQGNFIGTNANGSADRGNLNDGVDVFDASNSTIGGTGVGARNLISGNGDEGLQVLGERATGNKVLGNYIGTDKNGTAALGNSGDGVIVVDASDNTIGGTEVGARNIISGNDQNGVEIQDGFAIGIPTGNRVEGNFIGTDASGTAALGNSLDGVRITDAPDNSGASDNTVGGTEVGARNIISGNDQNGVEIVGSGATGNKVQGNRIGTNASGNQDLGNSVSGVVIDGAPNNVIGGTEVGARNLISGNDADGVLIQNTDATGNEVFGNFIGTDDSGTQPLGNSGDGVRISRGPNNTIGGTSAGTANIISGNSGSSSDGVEIFGSESTGNRVEGNRIGTMADGTGDLGNADDGLVLNGAPNNTIGGTISGARNLISGNGGNGVKLVGSGANDNEVKGNFIRVNDDDGVDVSGDDNTIESNSIFANAGDGVEVFSSGQGNSILSNRIFDNVGLGIDLLGTNGVTINDTDDPDAGGNNLQNFPVITSATRSNATGVTTISGRINSNPNQSFTIQCFLSDGDPSNHGEGQFFLGQRTLTDTNGDGDIAFRQACASTIPDVGQTVSVTATNTSGTATNTRIGDTSEFSLNRSVTSGS